MDIATLIGIIAGMGVIFGAILMGGSLDSFVDAPSVMVVFGGTAAATLIKFPMRDVIKSLKIGVGIAFKNPKEVTLSIYEKAIELAGLVRKNGLLGLENVEIENEIMARGIRMCVDGHSGEVIRSSISSEVEKSIQNDELGELERAMDAAETLLKPGGRLVVVTFHSLEDRQVKTFMKERSGDPNKMSRRLPGEPEVAIPTFTAITRKAVTCF